MNVYFNLNLISNCTLQISDSTQEYGEYLPEESNLYITVGRFKYVDTYTVNIIKSVEVKKTDIVSTIITPHVDDEGTPLFCDETCYYLSKDGHYIIDHMIVPSIECVQNNVDINLYDFVYATDGINFFKLVEGNFEECSVEELIEVNSELRTTVSKASQDTFSLCLLNNRYLELCKQHIDQLMIDRCKTKPSLDLDLIWLSLNAIKYYVELGMLSQAQSLLEDVYSCTGVSQLINNNLNNSTNHGCNCGL